MPNVNTKPSGMMQLIISIKMMTGNVQYALKVWIDRNYVHVLPLVCNLANSLLYSEYVRNLYVREKYRIWTRHAMLADLPLITKVSWDQISSNITLCCQFKSIRDFQTSKSHFNKTERILDNGLDDHFG